MLTSDSFIQYPQEKRLKMLPYQRLQIGRKKIKHSWSLNRLSRSHSKSCQLASLAYMQKRPLSKLHSRCFESTSLLKIRSMQSRFTAMASTLPSEKKDCVKLTVHCGWGNFAKCNFAEGHHARLCQMQKVPKKTYLFSFGKCSGSTARTSVKTLGCCTKETAEALPGLPKYEYLR